MILTEQTCWYDNNRGLLRGNKLAKARAYNRNKLISSLGCNMYFLKALPHNNQDHTVFFDGLNNSCTCQAFQLKGEFCSHLFAVALFIKNNSGKGVIE